MLAVIDMSALLESTMEPALHCSNNQFFAASLFIHKKALKCRSQTKAYGYAILLFDIFGWISLEETRLNETGYRLLFVWTDGCPSGRALMNG
jgi:hypothetical protein